MNDVTFKIGRRIGAHASTSRLFDSCICGESVTLKISFGSGFLSKSNSEGVTPDVFNRGNFSNKTQLKVNFTDVNKRSRKRFMQQKLAVHCA